LNGNAVILVVQDFGPLPKVPVDREHLHSVLTNLFLNARDALGQGGRIEVKTRQEDDWIVLQVADNGCGMTPEFVRNSLFRPFSTTKQNGLGIGLFQSKKIIEAHGGAMQVGSDAGKGTTFRIRLPRKMRTS
jgi:signal transduction histidine kinase